ncbi:MAG: DUF5683 domain-containing protein [Bacteroidota bacterium]
MKPFVYSALLWIIISPEGRAQVSPRYERPIATPLRILSLPDTVIHVFNEDSAVAKMSFSSDTVRRPGKSTTVALLASLVVPGAGQIYNGSYWKPPILWGVGYYFISVYNQQNKLYQQSRRAYAASINSNQVDGDQNILRLRDFYHNQRDTFAWYLAIEYIVNLLDAYVDASLYNFEVSPNLQPTTEMRASLRIPL